MNHPFSIPHWSGDISCITSSIFTVTAPPDELTVISCPESVVNVLVAAKSVEKQLQVQHGIQNCFQILSTTQLSN